MTKNQEQQITEVSPQQKWKNAVGKFKRALVPEIHNLGQARDAIVDSVRVRLEYGDYFYLEEVAHSLYHGYDLPLNQNQLQNCKITYDAFSKCIVGSKTLQIFSSTKTNFVMHKDGSLYFLSKLHPSFFDGIPLEMAGSMRIQDGKIDSLIADSGHYIPGELDMYRGIKVLKKMMPEVFTPNCNIVLVEGWHYISLNLNKFIAMMESHNMQGIARHEELRKQRIEEIVEYKNNLLNKVPMKDHLPLQDTANINIEYDGDILNALANMNMLQKEALKLSLPKPIIEVCLINPQTKSTSKHSLGEIIQAILAYKRVDVMSVLLNIGINNHNDYKDCAPFSTALRNKDPNMANLILEKATETEINTSDISNNFPLHLTIKNGYEDITEQLINKGVNMHAEDSNAVKPLIYAIEKGDYATVEKLLQAAGADVNIGYRRFSSDDTGVPPLIHVLKNSQLDNKKMYALCDLLFTYGALADVKDPKYGDTALSFADKTGFPEIKTLIQGEINKLLKTQITMEQFKESLVESNTQESTINTDQTVELLG